MGKKVEVKKVETEVKAENTAKARVEVKALQFLKNLNLDWVLERPLEDGDISTLNAKVNAGENGVEWASWITPYRKIDGKDVPGIAWGISAPITGKFIILRLLESGTAKAKLRVWPSGKGILEGSPEIVKALIGRGDLPAWTDQDTASLL